MPLPYRSSRLELPGLKGMDETTDQGKHITILRDALDQLAQSVTVEFQRNEASMNGVGGQKNAFRIASANTIFASTDGTLAFDTTNNTVDAILPKTTEYPGLIVAVFKLTGGNAATLTAQSGDTITGGSPLAVTTIVYFQADVVNRNWQQI
mgnify:CR=1 FL=1